VPDAFPQRSRFPTVLGILALLMGAWGWRFIYWVRVAFDLMVQRVGPVGGPFREGPRPSIEPWVLAYCALSTILMSAGGLGLVLRRRWGPALAGLAGEAWSITSIGFLICHAGILVRLRLPPSRSADLIHRTSVMMGARSLVTLALGLACLSCLHQRRLREECGGATPTPWKLLLAVTGWGLVSVGVTFAWLDWYWKIFRI
jgi:hypothetical protein